MDIKDIPLDTLVTVRVKGQSKRLSGVTLHRLDGVTDKVAVRNGRRGRPVHLPLDRISQVKVLAKA